MTSPIQNMLEGYRCQNIEEYRHALKEIIQEITLLGLYRGGFFRHAAFYGGTALRIFHGLDRFSEDLDFSLDKPGEDFDLETWLPPVRDELGAYGFELTVEKKEKTSDSDIQSAFVKGGTMTHLLKIASIQPPVEGVHPEEQFRIKFEIDTAPPPGATFQIKYQLVPTTYSVRLYDLPSLFAGKLHALLCRSWKNRVKGRDYYDYAWYLSKGIKVNLDHLESRMRQSGHWNESAPLTMKDLHALLFHRFSTVDMRQAIADVSPFIKDQRVLDLWSSEFFSSITAERLVD